jgi:hypothetical protein
MFSRRTLLGSIWSASPEARRGPALGRKDPLKPERRETNAADKSSLLLFFFPRGEAPIAKEDNELVFATQFGPMEMKAMFPLKEMLYRGKLEL